MTTDVDEAFYRVTVEQRDAAWREVERWRARAEAAEEVNRRLQSTLDRLLDEADEDDPQCEQP